MKRFHSSFLCLPAAFCCDFVNHHRDDVQRPTQPVDPLYKVLGASRSTDMSGSVRSPVSHVRRAAVAAHVHPLMKCMQFGRTASLTVCFYG